MLWPSPEWLAFLSELVMVRRLVEFWQWRLVCEPCSATSGTFAVAFQCRKPATSRLAKSRRAASVRITSL